MKTKRLGGYSYEISNDSGKLLGLVSVFRCGKRSQTYQVTLPNGAVLAEFGSVKKAAEAAQMVAS